MARGKLIVLEGPDGIGKTTLCARLADFLRSSRIASQQVSFPGREPGTLGRVVYDLHHRAGPSGLVFLDPVCCQLLYVCAHIETIHRIIRPALLRGEVVILDRYWWSTLVYGTHAGVEIRSLNLMMKLEQHHWGRIQPACVFLLDRNTQARKEHSDGDYLILRTRYRELADQQRKRHRVETIDTDGPEEESFHKVRHHVSDIVGPSRFKQTSLLDPKLPFAVTPQAMRQQTPLAFGRRASIIPSHVYDTFWKFAAERQEIFFKRFHNVAPPWTDDDILRKFKFTNVYRASDRVSQFLIRNVIYSGSQEAQEIFFRTILFKLFNKIETWKLLAAELGFPSATSFDPLDYDRVLSGAMAARQTIYSAAYIMPSGGKHGEPKKHLNHLRLLKKMLDDKIPDKIAESTRMKEAFDLLRTYPMIGDFLAYQYVTDLNYSVLTKFNEKEFVVPGPGARDGIHKCFRDLGEFTEASVIELVVDMQEQEFEKRGIAFRSLWGRPLQLIDCQNLFCEIGKYARHAHPEVAGISGRVRIKQTFRSSGDVLSFWYPPKWGINELIAREQQTLYAGVSI